MLPVERQEHRKELVAHGPNNASLSDAGPGMLDQTCQDRGTSLMALQRGMPDVSGIPDD